MLVVLISFAVSALDQATKLLIQRSLSLGGRAVVVPGFFDLVHIRNTGAAFGMFQGGNAALAILSSVVLILLTAFRRRWIGENLCGRIAAGLMAGGIVGNLADRLRYGSVVDFLDFYWNRYHFPSFNVADSAICCGVVLYFAGHWIGSWRNRNAGAGSAAGAGKEAL
jgi:signal peptidase II